MSDFFLCMWVFSATIYVFLLGSRISQIEKTLKQHNIKENTND